MDAGNVNDDLAVKDSGTVNGYLTNKLRGGALVTLLTSALTVLDLSPQLVEEIEDRSWDWRVQLTAKKKRRPAN